MGEVSDLHPQRIVLVLPCCIGDVLMATATLAALRRAWPDAHIAWAVGGAARAVISDHDMLDATLECDPLPQRSPQQLLRLARQLRQGHYDLAVSLTRSPLLSLAVRMSGIPLRAGLDSAGRGLGYNLRVPLDPAQLRHEAEIYLDVARALGLDAGGCQANVPVREALWPGLRHRLLAAGVDPQRYALLLPAGGSNPGMTMTQKRWPPQHYAQLARQLGMDIVLVGGPEDSRRTGCSGRAAGRALAQPGGRTLLRRDRAAGTSRARRRWQRQRPHASCCRRRGAHGRHLRPQRPAPLRAFRARRAGAVATRPTARERRERRRHARLELAAARHRCG